MLYYRGHRSKSEILDFHMSFCDVLIQGPLCPHSYQANLSLWSFYLDNHLSQFPPYDIEFLSEGELTPVDLHYNFFERDKSLAAPGSGQKGIDGFSLMDMSAGMRGVGTLLLEYTGEGREGGREGGGGRRGRSSNVSH